MRLNKRLLKVLDAIENQNAGQWIRSKKKFTVYLHSSYPEEWKDWHNVNQIHNALFELPEVRKPSIQQDFDRICGRVVLTFDIK